METANKLLCPPKTIADEVKIAFSQTNRDESWKPRTHATLHVVQLIESIPHVMRFPHCLPSHDPPYIKFDGQVQVKAT